jgi:hypothetical protein
VLKRSIVGALCFALAGAASANAQSGRATAHAGAADNNRVFYAAGQLYRLDPDLLAAIATVESGGNSGAVSPKGAQGLMQLMPATASRFRVHDPFDPISNTLGAARFISYLRQFRIESGEGENLSLAEMIAAYNAGEGAVQKYNGIPPYPETQQYVRKVLIAYLFGDTQSELASRLRAIGPAPAPLKTRTHPVAVHERDPIEKLTEIQHLRELRMNGPITTTSRIGGNDGSH